ncbi:MAG TPA: 3-oxoacyl-[acyl-carrier-protein] reductase [Bdellovibrionales bacterium]|nr:3-oxoacyl-[acyl-carrier-protein] reductase [Bdellovibrionales bacterium]
MHLKGKRIVVTGSSRGIGAGIAKHLAEHGARVAVTYSSSAASAEKIVGELKGEGHILVSMNVSDSASVEAGFAEIMSRFDGIDGLVNNAGITRDQLLMRMKDEDFDAVIATNLRGAYLCSKAVMRPMLKARAGAIVNISSVIGQMGNAGQSNYAASKGGLEGFTRSVALEVASRGIRVNAVAPGFIVTDMTDALDEKQKEAIQSKIPLQRLGSVEDISHAVSFLLGDASLYITGQVLQVNGGLYM